MFKISKMLFPKLILSLLLPLSLGSNAAELKLFATNYPPFDIANNPQQPGFDVEVAVAAFAASGISVTVDFHPWARIMRDVKSGKATAAVTCSDVADRNEFVHLSDAISTTRVAMITRRDHRGPVPTVVEDMRNKKVITINGYATQKELIEKNIQHLSVNRVKDAFNVLLHRDQDIFYVGWESAAYTAKQLDITELLTFSAVSNIEAHPFYLCFSKAWPESESLVKTFNSGLASIKTNGELKKIYVKYGL